MTLQIGIDLGTTNSLIAQFHNGETRLIPNQHGHFLTPSVISVAEDGSILTGIAARERLSTAPTPTPPAAPRGGGFSLASRKISPGARRTLPAGRTSS